MQTSCKHCGSPFEVTDDDLALYSKLSPSIGGKSHALPPPALCSRCRQQRRYAFRNERHLYSRICDRCNKSIVSIYRPDSPVTVYCHSCFWSDAWDPCDFGREIDWNRPFTEQFRELMLSVPQLTSIAFNSPNCEYNNFCVDSKDCYLCTRVVSEHAYYSYLPLQCLWCMDCYDVFGCQYCYECVDCWDCYGTKFSTLCRNCNDCLFCEDCIGCRNCIGCVGLRNAEYCFCNEKVGKERFEELSKEYALTSEKNLRALEKKFLEHRLQSPVRNLIVNQSENIRGNYLSRCKDVIDCFDMEETETARYSAGVEYSRDIVDSDFIYKGERCLENISNTTSSNVLFSFAAFNSHDLLYCMCCFNNTRDCFGSLSLRQKQHCIFNKQYSKEEYNELVPKLIAHMRSTKEWGEFFAADLSPFGYDETVAQEFFPLEKAAAEKQRFAWSGYVQPKPSVKKTIPAAQLPDSVTQIPDDILQWAITCEASGRPFRILKQELEFYRQQGLPIPRKHPDVRHARRFSLRLPRRLWNRACAQCSKPIVTAYSPERPETVYCEACYRETVY